MPRTPDQCHETLDAWVLSCCQSRRCWRVGADALYRVFLPSAWSTRYAYFCLMSSTDLRYSSGFGLLRSQRALGECRANCAAAAAKAACERVLEVLEGYRSTLRTQPEAMPQQPLPAACACGRPTAAVRCGAAQWSAVQCIVSLRAKRLQGVAARGRSFRELEFGTRVPELLADERRQLKLQKASLDQPRPLTTVLNSAHSGWCTRSKAVG